MNTPAPWLIRFLLLSSFLLPPSTLSSLRADGGTVRLAQRQGDYQITVFTTPTPFRAGPVDVSVLVQDVRTGQPIPDTQVTVRASPAGQGAEPIVRSATSEAATNKLFHAAVFELPAPGWWDFEVTVAGHAEPVHVRFELEAAEAAPPWPALWPWLAWPALAIVLFGIHQWLVRRRNRQHEARRAGASAAPLTPDANPLA